jgi:hypothetical protein
MKKRMPRFSAEAALGGRGNLGFLRGLSVGLIECTPDGGTCLCQGYDDCIHMLVTMCGDNWTCSDAGPICICDTR